MLILPWYAYAFCFHRQGDGNCVRGTPSTCHTLQLLHLARRGLSRFTFIRRLFRRLSRFQESFDPTSQRAMVFDTRDVVMRVQMTLAARNIGARMRRVRITDI